MATNFYKVGTSYYRADTGAKVPDVSTLQALARAGGKEVSAPTQSPSPSPVATPTISSMAGTSLGLKTSGGGAAGGGGGRLGGTSATDRDLFSITNANNIDTKGYVTNSPGFQVPQKKDPRALFDTGLMYGPSAPTKIGTKDTSSLSTLTAAPGASSSLSNNWINALSNTSGGNNNQVNSLYQKYFGRNASEAELNNWMKESPSSLESFLQKEQVKYGVSQGDRSNVFNDMPVSSGSSSSSGMMYGGSTSGSSTAGSNIQQNQTQTKNIENEYNTAIKNLLSSMQSSGQDTTDTDLQKQYQTMLTGRYNKTTEMTPEQMRVLTPDQQNALRNQDIKGIDNRLDELASTIKSRAASREEKRQAAMEMANLSIKLEQLEIDKQKASQTGYESGTIGEYQFYAEQELANGRQPKSFEEYQNQDANRKILASQVAGANSMTPQQTSQFYSLVDKREKSPLIAALTRTTVLKNSIDDIRKDPSNGALQLNLVYPYIQALDTYQSSVREGELANVNAIDSKIGGLKNYADKIVSGQIVRPEVALQIAEAAEKIVDAIQKGAQSAEKRYAAAAQVGGIGSSWNEYVQTAGASNQTQSGDTGKDYAELDNILGFNKPLSMGQKGSSNILSSAISTVKPQGTKGGQCGEFVHSVVANYPYGLNTLKQKESILNVSKKQVPRVGDVLVQKIGGSTGHVAVVNFVDPVTGKIRLTESNYYEKSRPEIVTHNREIKLNDPSISGYFRGELKSSIAKKAGLNNIA